MQQVPQDLGMDQPPALGLGQLAALRRAKCQRCSLGFSREKLPELRGITVDFVLAWTGCGKVFKNTMRTGEETSGVSRPGADPWSELRQLLHFLLLEKRPI